jgi:hypothetical protein
MEMTDGIYSIFKDFFVAISLAFCRRDSKSFSFSNSDALTVFNIKNDATLSKKILFICDTLPLFRILH